MKIDELISRSLLFLTWNLRFGAMRYINKKIKIKNTCEHMGIFFHQIPDSNWHIMLSLARVYAIIFKITLSFCRMELTEWTSGRSIFKLCFIFLIFSIILNSNLKMNLLNKKEFCSSFCQHPQCWEAILKYQEPIQQNAITEEFFYLDLKKINKSYENSGIYINF